MFAQVVDNSSFGNYPHPDDHNLLILRGSDHLLSLKACFEIRFPYQITIIRYGSVVVVVVFTFGKMGIMINPAG